MIEIWEFLNNWAPLPISIFAAFYSFKNYLESKPKIEVNQIDIKNSSVLIEPDRFKDDFEDPDRLWTKRYRVISDIVIINKSSKPITIIEMKLNDDFIYNSYSTPGEDYKVTTKNSKLVENGISMLGNEESVGFSIEDAWLNFLIDIGPNSAIRGHIFFAFKDLNKVKIGKNQLEILTSRKTFKTELLITEEYYSQLLPQEKFDLDKYPKIL